MKRLFMPIVALAALTLPASVACAPKAAVPAPVAEPAPPPPDPNAWRATRPGPGAERPWTAPSAASFTLSNGIPVHLVTQGVLPLVSVRLQIGVGREANPIGKEGLIALTANMLDEGTKSKDGATIAATASELGAELGISGGDESVVLSLDALTGETLGPSLDLLAEVALQPRFDKADFARLQGNVLSSLQGAKSDPSDAARRTFLSQLWGAKHPYGTPSVGSEASVKALKLADVQKAYAEWFHSGNAAIVVAGNIDQAALRPMLESRFGAWKKGKSTRLAAAPPSPPLKNRIVFQEQPGSVQSVLRIGTVAGSRTSPEYWSHQVALNLFGGMFGSRLNMNLREEQGWSYGAYAGFAESRDYGIVQARTSVQADKTAPAVLEVLKEMRAQAGRTATDAELKLTRDSLTKSLPGSFENNAATAGAFLSVPLYGLPGDHFTKYADAVNAVDAAAVAASSQKLLDAEKMLIVVVGPRTIEVDDGKGAKVTVDVVGELKSLGMEFVEVK